MTLVDLALRLAARGLPVFPCGRSKKPVIRKVDGGRGFHDATTDPATVRRLFSHRNAALVGVPTGEASGFDVLDLDYRHGAAAWEEANLQRLPETRVHETQSGGRHLLFIHAPGVRNSAGEIAPGVDVRGEGGYVIMPPSSGYSVIADAEAAHWPDWLLPIVLPKPAPARVIEVPNVTTPVSGTRLEAIKIAALKRVHDAVDGQKHFTLRNAALLLGGIADQAGYSDGESVRWLLDALPSSAKDRRGAEATAVWGLIEGRKRPVVIPEKPIEQASDPRRRETAASACRMLRQAFPAEHVLHALHEENRRRSEPLPEDVVNGLTVWAARKISQGAHAR